MEGRRICGSILVFIAVGIDVFVTASSFGPLGRASDLDIGLFTLKDGECPSSSPVSSSVDGSTCSKACFLDMDCTGQKKCCQNGCGGTHCHLPIHLVERCDGHECTGQGETCDVLNDQPSCICISNCNESEDQVCADDGRVYSSRCWMDVAACEGNTTISEIPCTDLTTPQPNDGPPVMLIDSDRFTVNAHEDLVLRCDAASPSEVSYAWIVTQHGVNMAVLLPGTVHDNIMVSLDGKVIFISAATVDDAGNYGCLASNSYGLSTINHKVAVNAPENPPTPSRVRPTTELPERGGGGAEQSNQPDPDVEHNMLATPNAVCVQNLDRGHCFRREVKWFYNLQSQRCEPFIYGGCGGNGNRFRTYEACSQTCPNLPDDPCRHPIVTGRCRARFIRWAYDETTGSCREFVYGGCGANGNNFRTREECGYTCQDREAKKKQCECTRPRVRSSYCSSDFVISGRVRQEIPSTENGPLLIVELVKLYKTPESFTVRLGDQAGNITMLRDLSRTPRGCHCITYTPDADYIFMGRMNDEGEAVIDDDSYVSPSNTKRRAKIAEVTRCPGENSVPPVERIMGKGDALQELSPGLLEENIHVQRELDSRNLFNIPQYQRKPGRRSRVPKGKRN